MSNRRKFILGAATLLGSALGLGALAKVSSTTPAAPAAECDCPCCCCDDCGCTGESCSDDCCPCPAGCPEAPAASTDPC